MFIDDGMGLPILSIVIPAFNREREISRAIRSCLIQDNADFEVIVVDDGSTDNCYGIAAAIPDPRLSLLRHPINRGGNAARNTGALAAKGEWVIFLDSDDELAPGALETISAIAAKAESNVHRLAFMYRRDDGRVSPWPALRDQIVDYRGYLAWLEGRRIYDFLPCTRRLTFQHIRYPENRWSDHALYQMDFAKRYRTWFREEILAFVHLDAANRLGDLRRRPKHARISAAELGKDVDALLECHGAAMRQFAPRTLQKFYRLRAAYHFLAGNRGAGIRQGLACLRVTPLLPELWSLLILGIAHTSALATVRSWRRPIQGFIRERCSVAFTSIYTSPSAQGKARHSPSSGN
jgi:glycosyltransferase involved in cell wall biosynthesis